MQFDSHELIQFWQKLVNKNNLSSPNVAEIAAKLFQQPTQPLWQPFVSPTRSTAAGSSDSVDHFAQQLRDFIGDLSQSWQQTAPPGRPVTDSLAAGQLWDSFLDLGSARFQTLTHDEGFAAELANCINDLNRRAMQGANSAADLGPLAHQFATTAAGLSDTDPLHAEREEMLRIGTMTLYRYAPEAEPKVMPPVLIVYALINTADIVDLDPERSLVRALLQQGIPVYLIDWGFPVASDKDLGLDDYVIHRLKPAMDAVRADSASTQLSLFGVCQGGVLSLSACALFPDDVRQLVLTVTPIDFQTPDNVLSRWVRGVDIPALVKQHGNIPGEYLYWLFVSLNPFELLYRKYLRMATIQQADGQPDEGAVRRFMRMERWVQNVPDLAGRAFQEFVMALYQRNDLINGRFSIGEHPVRLSDIRQPILNFYATRDHIVPESAAMALESCSQTCQSVALEGGHIGAIVSARNIRRISSTVSDWLET